MADVDAGPEVGKGKREAKLTRFYLHESGEGEKSARCGLDVTHVGFTLAATGEDILFDLKKIFGGQLPPPSVGRAAAAFGINTSAGNAGNTAGSSDPADIREAVEARLEQFADNEWTSERASTGPRNSVLLEALIAFRSANGADTSPERMQAIAQGLKDDPEKKKQWMQVPEFRKVYERIRAEKAAARDAAKPAVDVNATDMLK